MANRFGKSNWQDVDRLNLMKVCLKYQKWDERLREMRATYPNIPLGYFTENSCREELERIMSLPTPNVRLDVSNTFVYSRKIIMEKWIDHLKAEVKKSQDSELELYLVKLRSNFSLLKELVTPGITEKRKDELFAILQPIAEQKKNDDSFKRVIGSLNLAATDILSKNPAIDLSNIELPPSKEPDEEMDTGTNDFLTPATSAETYDMSFFSPPRKRLTLAEALAEAVPIPAPPPVPVFEEMPDDFLEPPARSPIREEEMPSSPRKNVVPDSPIKKPTEETSKKRIPAEVLSVESSQVTPYTPEQQALQSPKQDASEASSKQPASSPNKQIVTPSSEQQPTSSGQPIAPSRTAQRTARKIESSVLEVKVEDIKKEEATPSPLLDSTPAPSERPVASSPSLRSRARPRHSSHSSSTTKKNDDSSETLKEETPEPSAVPPRRRLQERSQEPTIPGSSRKRNARKPHEDSPSIPPLSRSESGVDLLAASPLNLPCREIEVQTEITIREAVEEVSIGERRRTRGVQQPVRKGRKSQAPTEAARSMSRASSASTSVIRNQTRHIAVQTSPRFELDEKEIILFHVDIHPKYSLPVADHESTLQQINVETCNEIDRENAARAEQKTEVVDSTEDEEITVVVETDEPAGNKLKSDLGFEVASAMSDHRYVRISAGLRDVTSQSRNRDKTAEAAMKANLMKRWDTIERHPCAEPFREPVPECEEEYGLGIHEKVDLSAIRRDIDTGVVDGLTLFLLRTYRMFSNAVMFNGYDHDVALQAKDIHCSTMKLMVQEIAEKSKKGHPCSVTTYSRDQSIDQEGPSTPLAEREVSIPHSIEGSSTKISRREQSTEGAATPTGSRRLKRQKPAK
ncbi:Protein CBG02464 [Caenorhabditis briggsae]|uniref:Protein CBG02464 n=1 Tax=Caenorhabditis briggsae TaxID=6238 RepID=A8WU95_CAEBR|nr:Protein CBG02464 [Caenorhabditis briggsae]CAP24057.1 Protein CBG02464 [Caenorhabditis briggsae]